MSVISGSPLPSREGLGERARPNVKKQSMSSEPNRLADDRGSTARNRPLPKGEGSRKPLAIAALLASAALLAGCHVDQKAEVAKYRRVLDATAPAPAAPTWSDDHPLALGEAMALANANNEQLARGGEDYVQAIIFKNRAVAAFLPTLSFQPAYSVIESPSGNQPAGTSPGGGTSVVPGAGASGVVTGGASGYRRLGGGDSNVLHRFEAPLTGSINLFRAGADVQNLRAAESNIEARRLLLLDLQSSTLLNVAQAYYAVLRAERSVAVLGNSLSLQEARLADVQQQFNNGLATRLTVAQSKSQVEGTRATLIQAQGDVANARSTLALIVGVPKVDAPLVDNYRAPQSLAPRDEFEQQAIRTRPDLAAAVALEDVQRNSVAVAFAQYYPSVSLNVSGFLYREYYSDASKWSAILSANLPIFSGGLIQADVRAAWSRLRQAALDESYTRRSILDQVHQSYQNFTTADLRLRALDDRVSAAKEALQQARGAYAASLATNLDVLTAQDELLTAQLQQTNAAFDRTVFFLDLLRSTGTLTGNDIANVTRPTTQATTLPAESGS